MTDHTKLPWRVFTNPDGTKLVGIGGQDGQGILDAGFGVWAWNDPQGIANAAFVVKAVNSHKELTAKLDEAVKLLDGLLGLEKGSGQAALEFIERYHAAVGSARGGS
jgi:hypothetical protein